ncbi:AraC family transcriptional regulator [Cohnella soli]|uniref:AraC family transcriptional regulator n=1 Tax=Cohnella soli TaxID=425005 RepID=A0ABW0I156_9BACL
MEKLSWNELNPVVNFALLLKCEPSFQYGPRIIGNHQLIYISKGKGIGEIGSASYVAEAGDLFYYGPGVVHWFRADEREPFEIYGMHFDLNKGLEAANDPLVIREVGPEEIRRLLHTENGLMIGEQGLDFLRVEDKQQIKGTPIPELLMSIVQQYRSSSDKSAVANRGMLLQTFVLLQQYQGRDESAMSPQERIVRDIRRRLEQLAEQPYDRGWLSVWSGYNEDYVCRMFLKVCNMTPHRYHSLQKIQRAKELLTGTEWTASELAERLHVGSLHYFSKWFKAATGMSPIAYRRRQRLI